MKLFFREKSGKLRVVETEHDVDLNFQKNIKKFIEGEMEVEVNLPILTCYDHIPEDQPEPLATA